MAAKPEAAMLDNSRNNLKAILEKEGVLPALRFLNGRTPHRFTAMYLFDKDQLENQFLVDESDDSNTSMESIPVSASYCIFVRNLERLFVVNDSTTDERVQGHPKQREIKSYCGVPLLDWDGNMYGTVCHFDFDAHSFSDLEIELLESLGTLLKRLPPGAGSAT